MKQLPPIGVTPRKVQMRTIRRQLTKLGNAIHSNNNMMAQLYEPMTEALKRRHYKTAAIVRSQRRRLNRDMGKLIRSQVELHAEFHMLGREIIHIRQGLFTPVEE